MNLLLLAPADFTGPDTVRVGGQRWKHLRDIIKVERTGRVKAGLIGGKVGHAVLTSVDEKHESGVFTVTLDSQPPEKLPVILLCALQRPPTVRKIVQCAVAAGVRGILFFGSRKVEKSYWSSPVISDNGLREDILLALAQSGDTIPPELEFHPHFTPFIENRVPRLLENGYKLLLAHPGAAELHRGSDFGTQLAVAIGPEGGFTGIEAERFITAGATPVGLGVRIFRSEFAVAALLSRLAM